MAPKTGKENWRIISARVSDFRQVIQRATATGPVGEPSDDGTETSGVLGLTDEVERTVSLAITQIRQKIIDNPGISHTELLRSVAGPRDQKETALRELLDQGEIRSEQKGRARRYFIP